MATESAVPRAVPPCSVCSGPPRRKLLLLGMDGLLVKRHSIYESHPRVNESPDWFIKGDDVFVRPCAREFVNFCLDHFNVAVWADCPRDVAVGLTQIVFGERVDEVQFVLNASAMTYAGCLNVERGFFDKRHIFSKKIEDVCTAYGADMNQMLLIDSNPEFGLLNPPNTGVFPYPYNPVLVEEEYLDPQNSFCKELLLGHKDAADVPDFVSKTEVWGLFRIRREDFGWPYYEQMIHCHRIFISRFRNIFHVLHDHEAGRRFGNMSRM